MCRAGGLKPPDLFGVRGARRVCRPPHLGDSAARHRGPAPRVRWCLVGRAFCRDFRRGSGQRVAGVRTRRGSVSSDLFGVRGARGPVVLPRLGDSANRHRIPAPRVRWCLLGRAVYRDCVLTTSESSRFGRATGLSPSELFGVRSAQWVCCPACTGVQRHRGPSTGSRSPGGPGGSSLLGLSAGVADAAAAPPCGSVGGCTRMCYTMRTRIRLLEFGVTHGSSHFRAGRLVCRSGD